MGRSQRQGGARDGVGGARDGAEPAGSAPAPASELSLQEEEETEHRSATSAGEGLWPVVDGWVKSCRERGWGAGALSRW